MFSHFFKLHKIKNPFSVDPSETYLAGLFAVLNNWSWKLN